jgi:hypothetical protein
MHWVMVSVAKKGMSTLQLGRMLGVTYKSAWFLCHLIREAMKPAKRGPLGGHGKVVEADETFIGGRRQGIRASRLGQPFKGRIRRPRRVERRHRRKPLCPDEARCL